jgi:hypothetical protein
MSGDEACNGNDSKEGMMVHVRCQAGVHRSSTMRAANCNTSAGIMSLQTGRPLTEQPLTVSGMHWEIGLLQRQ